MKKRIRYAVVGQGHFAQDAILPAFAQTKNSELVALVSHDPAKLKKLGKKYEVEHLLGYDELDAFLQSGAVDAVYLAVPNAQHRPFCERAARAHVHVLCEKPMAITVEDCEAMLRACQDNGVRLMIAYRLHFEPANLKAIEIAQGKNGQPGKLGELRLFTSTFTFQVTDGNIRTQADQGGGPLHDIGVYCINAARYLFRAEPTEVMAFAASRGDDKRFWEVDEQVTAMLRFPDERLATFAIGFGAADSGWYEIVGTDGRLRVDPAYDYVGPLRHQLQLDDKVKEKEFKPHDQIASELVYFSDCLIDDREPEPSGVEGLADVRVIEALQRSIDSGAPVTLGGFEKRDRPSRDQQVTRPAHGRTKTIHVEPPTR